MKRFMGIVLALGACHSYSPPAIEEMYRDDLKWAGHEGLVTPSPSEPVWERVRQQKYLTLADAYQLAIARSERIARAAESYLQSMTLRDRATAAFLPTIGITATQFFQEDVPSAGGNNTVDRREARATVSQPLFRGLRDFAGWRQTVATIDQRRSFFETERRLVFQLVALSFYNTLFLERQVRILEDSLKNTRERLREMQARRDQGIARKTEVLLIETQVASDEALLTRAKLALDLSRSQLAFLLGKPADAPLRDDMPESAVPAELDPLVQEALANRSDLREREASLRAAEENIRVISGEHLPNLDLSANFYMYREGFSTFATETDWDVLLSLTFNVFKGGDIRARTIEAESIYRVAVLNRNELRRQIHTEVANALLSLRANEDLIKTLENREKTSSENYKQIIEEYRQGLAGVTNLEVLVAQNQYLSAQLELDRQKLQRKLDWFQLQVSLGKIPVRIP